MWYVSYGSQFSRRIRGPGQPSTYHELVLSKAYTFWHFSRGHDVYSHVRLSWFLS